LIDTENEVIRPSEKQHHLLKHILLDFILMATQINHIAYCSVLIIIMLFNNIIQLIVPGDVHKS